MRTQRYLQKGIVIIAAVVTAMFLGLPNTTRATSVTLPLGHEGFAGNSTVCVVCHRTHTATTQNLLRSGAGICLSCHKSGVGADTDVTAGKYFVPAPPKAPRHTPPWGSNGGNLLAGGFALVDTNGDGTREQQAYQGTSQHDLGVTLVPYGSKSGASIEMNCSTCHSVHHDFNAPDQYRMLKADVNGQSGLSVTWNGPWADASQTAYGGEYMAYTETDFSSTVWPYNPVEYTRNYRFGLSAWCSGCHNVYIEPASPAGIGDGFGGTVMRRHKMDITLTNTGPLTGTPATDLPLNDLTGNGRTNDDTMSCVTCHRAHGTDTDSTAVGAYQAANRGVLPAMNTSMLLRRDNRGVCIDCHGYLNGM